MRETPLSFRVTGMKIPYQSGTHFTSPNLTLTYLTKLKNLIGFGNNAKNVRKTLRVDTLVTLLPFLACDMKKDVRRK